MQISIKELIKELATIRSLILFICILVLIKIRDYSSHLTYLDGNEVTAKVGFRVKFIPYIHILTSFDIL